MEYLIETVFSVFLLNFLISESEQSFKSVGEWKQLDYSFPNDQVRQMAIKNGQFIAANAVPIDVDVHYQGR